MLNSHHHFVLCLHFQWFINMNLVLHSISHSLVWSWSLSQKLILPLDPLLVAVDGPSWLVPSAAAQDLLLVSNVAQRSPAGSKLGGGASEALPQKLFRDLDRAEWRCWVVVVAAEAAAWFLLLESCRVAGWVGWWFTLFALINTVKQRNAVFSEYTDWSVGM